MSDNFAALVDLLGFDQTDDLDNILGHAVLEILDARYTIKEMGAELRYQKAKYIELRKKALLAGALK
jgi:hypothetical protein